MNGFYIPEICYNTINTNNVNDINKTNTNNIIKPVIDNNYNTFTYSNLDLVFKSDNKTLNVDENILSKNYYLFLVILKMIYGLILLILINIMLIIIQLH